MVLPSGAIVQNRLNAKAASMVNTAVGVNRVAVSLGLLTACGVRNRALDNTQSPHSSSSSLAALMIAIDNPTDMAAVQITTSRKLGILVGKMSAGVS